MWKLVAGGAVAATLAVPVGLEARPQYLTTFARTYSITSPLYKQRARLNTCKVCHTVTPARNPYGAAFQRAHRSGVSVVQSFRNIQLRDSDGDGFTNVREIRAGKFPGRKSDHP